MLIFNTTFHTEEDVHEVYIDFMKQVYIPQAVVSGFLTHPCFARIHPQHEQNGISYSLQFKVKNSDTLDYWMTRDGALLQQTLNQKFGNKVVGFITIMEQIDIA